MTITADEVRNNILRALDRAIAKGDDKSVSFIRSRLPRAAQIAADLNREFDAAETRELRSARRNDW